jgi:hypothetical protein
LAPCIYIFIHIDIHGVRRHERLMERMDKMLLDLRGTTRRRLLGCGQGCLGLGHGARIRACSMVVSLRIESQGCPHGDFGRDIHRHEDRHGTDGHSQHAAYGKRRRPWSG